MKGVQVLSARVSSEGVGMEGIRITSATISAEACADIIETAVSAGAVHGIGYWARVDHIVKNDANLPVLTITDIEADKEKQVTLTVVEIADAVNKMLTDPDGTDSRGWVHRLLDSDYTDGPLADVIIQVACNGKVLYG